MVAYWALARFPSLHHITPNNLSKSHSIISMSAIYAYKRNGKYCKFRWRHFIDTLHQKRFRPNSLKSWSNTMVNSSVSIKERQWHFLLFPPSLCRSHAIHLYRCYCSSSSGFELLSMSKTDKKQKIIEICNCHRQEQNIFF